MRLRCPRCRAGHLLGAHAVGERVRLRATARKLEIAVGTVGEVASYLAGPRGQVVRVAFARRGMESLELEITPCEIESVDHRVARIAVEQLERR
jgi:hypothetical protein